ncbi:mechanosensitive ion channel domain-containing protein [Orrella marina]|nr:mechanosensitive ion channel domain-containing protein [Orrella marina]
MLAQREGVSSSTTLSDSERAALLKSYDQSIADLRSLLTINEQIQTLEQTLLLAADRIADLAEQKRTAPQPRTHGDFGPMRLEQLELEQLELTQRLTQAQQSYQSAQARLSRLLGATQSLNTLLTDRKAALEQIAIELSTLSESSGQASVLARRQNLIARQRLYQAEIDYNSLTLANQVTLSNLAQAERDHASAQITRLRTEAANLASVIQERRQEIARQAREQANALQDLTTELPDGIAALASENTALRMELETILQSEQSMDFQLRELLALRTSLREDYERIRQRIAIVGHNASISSTLRSRLAELPRLAGLHALRAERDDEIADATQRQLEIDDQIRTLEHQASEIESLIGRHAADLSSFERGQLERQTEEVVSAYRNSLAELQSTWSRHINQLVALDAAQAELERLTRDYGTYIEQQLFWMPSTSALQIVSSRTGPWQPWLTSGEGIVQLGESWKQYISEFPFQVLATLLAFALVISRRSWAARELAHLSLAVRHIGTDSINLTVKGIGAHLIRAAPLPALLLLISTVMRGFSDPLSQPYASGLTSSATLIFTLGMIKEFSATNGVGSSHFGWPDQICSEVRAQLRWFLPLGAILSFLVGAYTLSSPPLTIQTLGSLSFILLLLGWLYVTWQLFGPRSCLRTLLKDNFPKSWVSQLHFIWYPALLLIPVILGTLSLAGYHYTAVQLEIRVQMTLWFLIGLYILVEFILRWLYVMARHLKHADNRRKRERQREMSQTQQPGEDETDSDSSLLTPQLPEINYESLSEQSKRLVHTGFVFAVLFGTWSIWVDLLPALDIWNRNVLGYGDGSGTASELAKLMPVTTVDILAGLFILVLTTLAARNIPGLLEIILLQRLPLDPGARYALTALTQYFIAGVGVFLSFSTMGVEWDKLQWLIAALGVGLGFGLQEIVANFVSGIILLFERPIRVGDVVTIDDTTGVVTRIQIRATTITNYDRQELVVPNKTFITGQLINWTLSDRLNRILLPVGISYDSNVECAMELINEAAKEIPEILADPAPLVSFESFGSDSLMLYLRAYLANLDNRLSVITRLHASILNKFRDADINIAFPQRDIHLDFKSPLDVMMMKKENDGSGKSKQSQ